MGGWGPAVILWDFYDLFSPIDLILSTFLETAVKSGGFLAQLTSALHKVVYLWKKNKVSNVEWHIKWKVMTPVFDLKPFWLIEGNLSLPQGCIKLNIQVTYSHGEVKWAPIGLKHWKVGY